jgi:hypothetical protein
VPHVNISKASLSAHQISLPDEKQVSKAGSATDLSNVVECLHWSICWEVMVEAHVPFLVAAPAPRLL